MALTKLAGGILIHHKVDPLFLVIPLLESLLKAVSQSELDDRRPPLMADSLTRGAQVS